MPGPLILAPKLDLAAASDLMVSLQAREDAELVLDLSEVKHLGALCVQVILSAARTMTADNRKISITNVSDRVADQLRVMGLTTDALSRGCQ